MKNKILVLSLLVILIGSFLSASSLAAKKVKIVFAKEEVLKIGKNIEISPQTKVDTATAIFGSVTVGGEVAGDVVAVGGSVYLKDTARIRGNVVAVGGEVIKERGAQIRGNITEVALPDFLKEAPLPRMVGSALVIGWSILNFFMLLGFIALACLTAVLIPKNLGYVSAAVEDHPLKMLGWGILSLILIPAAFVILAVSLIGIPLIPFFILALAVLIFIGHAALLQLTGKLLLKSLRVYNKPMVFEVLVGAVLIAVICFIPVIGFLIKIVFSILGLGGILMTRFATRLVRD